MPNSDYRIEKERVPVTLTTVSGATIEGELFVQSSARHHMGREEPADVMNGDDAFFPMALPEGGMMLVAKDQVRELAFDGTLDDDSSNGVGMRSSAMELTLTDGEVLAGSVFFEVTAGRSRLLDFLNRSNDRFLTLHTQDGIRLVNRRLIERVRPTD